MDFHVTEEPGARGFLAFPGYMPQLMEELRGRFSVTEELEAAELFGELVFFPEAPAPLRARLPFWAATSMDAPFSVRFDSVGAAAAALRGVQRNWADCSSLLFRRSALIQEKLPFVSRKAKPGPTVIPGAPMGLFALTEEHRLVASGKTGSALPAGRLVFQENHRGPPSRAYLKLWEALTLMATKTAAENSPGDAPESPSAFRPGVLPGPGSRCLDAGASPGGWTWALLELGAEVLAVDRSGFNAELRTKPGVTFRAHDAFTLPPEELGAFDWVCSDVICYPERLLEWVKKWVASGLAKNMVCTVKLQGSPGQGGTDWSVLESFAAIPGGTLRHLYYNKHELCWMWRKPAISDRLYS